MARTRQKKLSTSHQKASKQPAYVMPGYLGFGRQVLARLWGYRRVTGRLLGLSVVVIALTIGAVQYDSYTGLTASLEQVSGRLEAGLPKMLVEVGALFASLLGGALSADATEGQQLFLGITYLLLWLVLVWLLRYMGTGSDVKVRDGLYNATAPIIPTVLIAALGALQFLPAALLTVLLTALTTSGFGGMSFALAGLVVSVVGLTLTLYWVSGTLFAAIVATIPGTYPRTALRTARELIAGRRAAVVKRLAWLGLVVFVVNALVLLPILLLDALTGYVLPLVVVGVAIVTQVVCITYSFAYIYYLYRGIIDERAD